jgi:hypothetical protein
MRLTRATMVAGLAGLLLVAGAGCAHQSRATRPSTVASEPAAAGAPTRKVAANQRRAKIGKGLGATGGPAGREDLRPSASP